MVNDDYDQAIARKKHELAQGLFAINAHYNENLKRLFVELKNGMGLWISPLAIQVLHEANSKQLSIIEISPSGQGLHFPLLDEDLLISSLVLGKFGDDLWMKKYAEETVIAPSLWQNNQNAFEKAMSTFNS